MEMVQNVSKTFDELLTKNYILDWFQTFYKWWVIIRMAICQITIFKYNNIKYIKILIDHKILYNKNKNKWCLYILPEISKLKNILENENQNNI